MRKTIIIMIAVSAILFSGLLLTGCSDGSNTNSDDTGEFPADPPLPVRKTIMIFQVHGAGFGAELGADSNINTGAISHNFIELYNNSDEPIDLSGYSVQWANGKANGGGTIIAEDQEWNVIPLTGIIAAYGSYLIRGKKMNDSDGNNVGRLQITESDMDDESFYMSNRSFKVALLSSQTKITMSQPWDNVNGKPIIPELLDLVGARNGNNDSVEGFKGAVFPSYSKQQSIRRASFVDTGNNHNDFVGLDYRKWTSDNTSRLTDDQVLRFRPRTAAETAAGYTPVFNRNPDDGTGELNFSHVSGLYSAQFNLTLTAQEGSKIYYSTDGSIPVPEKAKSEGPIFLYSAPIIVKNRNGEPNVLAAHDNVAKMYPHLNDPDNGGILPRPYYPTVNQVPKATVIRAIAVDSDNKHSDVITKTYFIGNNLVKYGNHPVISIVTDPDNLLDNNTGIYVQGRGNSGNGYYYNYLRKGREWEREADLDFFDGARNVAFSSGVGIRVRGGYSRCFGQKSFNVYFRDEYVRGGYGFKNLSNYILIPGAVQSDGKTPVSRYKNFMLRNGGNDTEFTKLRDVYIQSLLSDRNFTTQAAVPAILYLNGEYWGFYNLQEKYSDNYLEYKFGVNKDNVVSFETGELSEGVESDRALYEELLSHRSKNMAIQANYDAFCDIFDIQSFIDYFAAEIYIGNHDWPFNNYQLWRVRDIEPGNPYGDGKWRWMLFDVEFSLELYSDYTSFDTYEARVKYDNTGIAVLFKALLKNDDFCRRYITTMMDLYNVNFNYDSCSAKLDAMANIYRPLMDDYYERFGGWYNFDSKVNSARNYLRDIGEEMTEVYLPKHFSHTGISASNLASVTLNTVGADNASITINTVTPALSSGTWTGKYYSAYPVTVTAHIPDGCTFINWTVNGGTAANPSDPATAVTFTGNVQITANYGLK